MDWIPLGPLPPHALAGQGSTTAQDFMVTDSYRILNALNG
jgi:hypothetical protein